MSLEEEKQMLNPITDVNAITLAKHADSSGLGIVDIYVRQALTNHTGPLAVHVPDALEYSWHEKIISETRRATVTVATLNDQVLKTLSDQYPSFKFVKSGDVNTHAILAAARRAEYLTIISALGIKATSVVTGSDFLVKDVGGFPSRWKEDMTHLVHCCSPVLSARDSARYTETEFRGRMGTHRKLPEICDKKGEDCAATAMSCIFVHSAYDMGSTGVADAMAKCGAHVAYITALFDPAVLIQKKYTHPVGQWHSVIDKGRITFHFVNDSSFSYDHDFEVYKSLFTNLLYTTSDGQTWYTAEHLRNACGSQYIKVVLVRNPNTLNLTNRLIRGNGNNVLISTLRWSDFLAVPDFEDIFDSGYISRELIVVPDNQFNPIYQFAITQQFGNTAEICASYRAILKYTTGRQAVRIISNVQISGASTDSERLSAELSLKLALAITILAQYHVNASYKVLSYTGKAKSKRTKSATFIERILSKLHSKFFGYLHERGLTNKTNVLPVVTGGLEILEQKAHKEFSGVYYDPSVDAYVIHDILQRVKITQETTATEDTIPGSVEPTHGNIGDALYDYLSPTIWDSIKATIRPPTSVLPEFVITLGCRFLTNDELNLGIHHECVTGPRELDNDKTYNKIIINAQKQVNYIHTAVGAKLSANAVVVIITTLQTPPNVVREAMSYANTFGKQRIVVGPQSTNRVFAILCYPGGPSVTPLTVESVYSTVVKGILASRPKTTLTVVADSECTAAGETIDVPGDGDCLFHAIGWLHNMTTLNVKKALIQTALSGEMDTETAFETIRIIACGEWGDINCLKVYAAAMNVTVCLHGEARIRLGNGSSTKHLHYAKEHYQPLSLCAGGSITGVTTVSSGTAPTGTMNCIPFAPEPARTLPIVADLDLLEKEVSEAINMYADSVVEESEGTDYYDAGEDIVADGGLSSLPVAKPRNIGEKFRTDYDAEDEEDMPKSSPRPPRNNDYDYLAHALELGIAGIAYLTSKAQTPKTDATPSSSSDVPLETVSPVREFGGRRLLVYSSIAACGYLATTRGRYTEKLACAAILATSAADLSKVDLTLVVAMFPLSRIVSTTNYAELAPRVKLYFTNCIPKSWSVVAPTRASVVAPTRASEVLALSIAETQTGGKASIVHRILDLVVEVRKANKDGLNMWKIVAYLKDKALDFIIPVLGASSTESKVTSAVQKTHEELVDRVRYTGTYKLRKLLAPLTGMDADLYYARTAPLSDNPVTKAAAKVSVSDLISIRSASLSTLSTMLLMRLPFYVDSTALQRGVSIALCGIMALQDPRKKWILFMPLAQAARQVFLKKYPDGVAVYTEDVLITAAGLVSGKSRVSDVFTSLKSCYSIRKRAQQGTVRTGRTVPATRRLAVASTSRKQTAAVVKSERKVDFDPKLASGAVSDYLARAKWVRANLDKKAQDIQAEVATDRKRVANHQGAFIANHISDRSAENLPCYCIYQGKVTPVSQANYPRVYIDELDVCPEILISEIDPVVVEHGYGGLDQGVAGSGKTTRIVNEVVKGDLVLSATRLGTEELRKRLKKAGKDGMCTIKTIDAFNMHWKSKDGKYDRLLVDEAYMAHPGAIFLAYARSKAKRLLAYGDMCQIPYVERSRYEATTSVLLSDYLPVISTHVKSFRCPKSACDLLSPIYMAKAGHAMESASNRDGTLKATIITSAPTDLNVDVILTFTEGEATELRKTYSHVTTIHKYQGNQTSRVAVVRTSTSEYEVFESTPHMLVALSRHTDSFEYLTVKSDKLFLMVNGSLSGGMSRRYKKGALELAYADAMKGLHGRDAVVSRILADLKTIATGTNDPIVTVQSLGCASHADKTTVRDPLVMNSTGDLSSLGAATFPVYTGFTNDVLGTIVARTTRSKTRTMIHVVSGVPGSGKTTDILKKAKRGDFIITTSEKTSRDVASTKARIITIDTLAMIYGLSSAVNTPRVVYVDDTDLLPVDSLIYLLGHFGVSVVYLYGNFFVDTPVTRVVLDVCNGIDVVLDTSYTLPKKVVHVANRLREHMTDSSWPKDDIRRLPYTTKSNVEGSARRCVKEVVCEKGVSYGYMTGADREAMTKINHTQIIDTDSARKVRVTVVSFDTGEVDIPRVLSYLAITTQHFVYASYVSSNKLVESLTPLNGGAFFDVDYSVDWKDGPPIPLEVETTFSIVLPPVETVALPLAARQPAFRRATPVPPTTIKEVQNLIDTLYPFNLRRDYDMINWRIFHERLVVDDFEGRVNTQRFVYKSPVPESVSLGLTGPAEPLRPINPVESLVGMQHRNLATFHTARYVDYDAEAEHLYRKFRDTYLVKWDTAPIVPAMHSLEAWWKVQSESSKMSVMKKAGSTYERINMYEYQTKRAVKIVLGSDAPFVRKACQTIAAHDKVYNSLFCSIFRQLRQRIMASLDPRFIIYTEVTDEDFGRELDARYGPELATMVPVEMDFSKYDKSQGLVALLFELRIMKHFGIPSAYCDMWYAAHVTTELKDWRQGIQLNLGAQRKSGDAATFIGNTVFSMALLSSAYDLSQSVGVFAGDDSVLWFPERPPDRSGYLMMRYDMQVKARYPRYVGFCSRYLINVEGEWLFLSDPVKMLVRLSKMRARTVTDIMEKIESVKDLLIPYKSFSASEVLAEAASDNLRLPLGTVFQAVEAVRALAYTDLKNWITESL